nr:MAG TPA: hypothetical protein [Caudoviricetes sp.]
MHGSNGSKLLMDSEQLILIFERDKMCVLDLLGRYLFYTFTLL